MTVTAKLNFPVLRFHNDFVSGGNRRSERKFDFSGAFVLEEWTDHTNHYLLDASGFLYKVEDIREMEWARLSLRKKIKLKLTNVTAPILYLKRNAPKSVWIEYDLSFVKSLDIVEAKELVVTEVLRVNAKWKSDGPSIREFKKILEKYETMEDLTGSSIAEGS